MFDRHTAARLAAVVGAVLVTVTAGACGSATGSEPDPRAARDADDAFPLTIDHIHGSTTLTEQPTRIVTLGVTDADIVLALGTVPVGNTGFTFYDDGLGPWADPYVGDAELTRLRSDSDPDFEQIAALAPDLILGISAGYDEAEYAKLSAIAPTISRPSGYAAYTVDRTVATTTVATAMGMREQGEELDRRTTELLARTVGGYPQLVGRTAVAILPYDGQYGAFLPGDARGAFLTSVGLQIPDAVTAQDTGDSFFVEVSRENVDILDSDLVLVLGPNENIDVVADNPLFATLTAARNDAVLAATVDERGAITYNSVLSIPYAIDTLVPRIAAALR